MFIDFLDAEIRKVGETFEPFYFRTFWLTSKQE